MRIITQVIGFSSIVLLGACSTTIAPVNFKGADVAGSYHAASPSLSYSESYSKVALRSSPTHNTTYTDQSSEIKNESYAMYTRDASAFSSNISQSYAGDIPNASTLNANIEIPPQCFQTEKQTGHPVNFKQGAMIDQPQLRHRTQANRPNGDAGKVGFYCAAFHYAVDHRGRVTDIDTLYNSHPNIDGVNFAKMAKNTLRGWSYQPGQVDKADAKFTGLTTVFFFEAN